MQTLNLFWTLMGGLCDFIASFTNKGVEGGFKLTSRKSYSETLMTSDFPGFSLNEVFTAAAAHPEVRGEG